MNYKYGNTYIECIPAIEQEYSQCSSVESCKLLNDLLDEDEYSLMKREYFRNHHVNRDSELFKLFYGDCPWDRFRKLI